MIELNVSTGQANEQISLTRHPFTCYRDVSTEQSRLFRWKTTDALGYARGGAIGRRKQVDQKRIAHLSQVMCEIFPVMY
jgi:hypothetical protein